MVPYHVNAYQNCPQHWQLLGTYHQYCLPKQCHQGGALEEDKVYSLMMHWCTKNNSVGIGVIRYILMIVGTSCNVLQIVLKIGSSTHARKVDLGGW